MATYYVQESTKIIPIGRQGENSASQIAFDISAWAEEYGDGTPVLLHQRCGDETSYPATVAVEDSYAVWTVSSTDTAYAGNGRCELQYVADGAVVKSRVYTTYVSESIEEILSDSDTEPAAGWIADLLEQIQALLDDAEILSDEEIYNLMVAYFEENPVADGSDGVSVSKLEQTATSSESGGVNVWTLTLSNGSTYDFTVRNGAQGDPGDAGASAYEVAVANGYTGTETEWLESLKGDPGDPGDPGDDGASAYEVAVENGYSGTEAEWLASLKGEPGEDGASAYEIAVENGFSGTEAEWLESLEGEAGTAATIKVGTVTTGEAGTEASVNNSGTDSEVVLDFVIPRGADGTSSTDEYDKFLLILYDADDDTATIPSMDDAEADYETVYNMLVSGVIPAVYVVSLSSPLCIAYTSYIDVDANIIYFLGAFGDQPMENLLYMTCSESGWSYKAAPFSSWSSTATGLPDASGYDDGYILITNGGEWTIVDLGNIEDITEEKF